MASDEVMGGIGTVSRLPTLQGFRVLSQGPRPVLSKLTEQGSTAERNLHALLNQTSAGHLQT